MESEAKRGIDQFAADAAERITGPSLQIAQRLAVKFAKEFEVSEEMLTLALQEDKLLTEIISTAFFARSVMGPAETFKESETGTLAKTMFAILEKRAKEVALNVKRMEQGVPLRRVQERAKGLLRKISCLL